MQRLIFFVKAPRKGKIKTRLAAEIGEERALALYKKIAPRCLDSMRGGPYDLRVAFFPPDQPAAISEWLGDDVDLMPQRGAELGKRMANAIGDSFSEGAQKVVLIGSDIPELSRQTIEEAFTFLEKSGAVINPTFDGGYCLIGFTSHGFDPAIFEAINWSTPTVFEETMERFSRNGTGVRVLPRLRDLDCAEDLKYFPDLAPKTISVIIPVLGEAELINHSIRELKPLDGAAECEIIVVDGGPGRETLHAIEENGIVKIASEKGRAKQMNLGAASAEGNILLFLHADTKLPGNAFQRIRDTINRGGYVGGAFDLSFDSSTPFLRLVAWWARQRSRLTRIPFGDQAIFLKRDYFDKLGGYKEIALMEDVELMRRIRSVGGKILILNDAIVTSARKYLREGAFYAVMRNFVVRLLYCLGTPPEKLEKLYYRK